MLAEHVVLHRIDAGAESRCTFEGDRHAAIGRPRTVNDDFAVRIERGERVDIRAAPGQRHDLPRRVDLERGEELWAKVFPLGGRDNDPAVPWLIPAFAPDFRVTGVGCAGDDLWRATPLCQDELIGGRDEQDLAVVGHLRPG